MMFYLEQRDCVCDYFKNNATLTTETNHCLTQLDDYNYFLNILQL